MKEIGGYKTIESALHTDFTTGLSNHNTKDLEERKEAFGSNEKPTVELPGILELLWDALQDFTLRILVLASALSVINNVKLSGSNITGKSNTGSLVGYNSGVISNSSSTGLTVTGGTTGANVGGLVGYSFTGSSITSSSSSGVVSGGTEVGGLLGQNYGGTVNYSSASGSVTALRTSYWRYGGLVGALYAGGTISNSHADVTVTGADTGSWMIGGLVGENNAGAILNSYATGSVATGGDMGGLVGLMAGGSVTTSYATGNISGNNNVGGLVGRNISSSNISNSFGAGNVTAAGSTAGGLIGSNEAGSQINYCYSTGAVAGTASGGLAGVNAGTIGKSFWDKDTSGQSASSGGVGMTTAQMMTTLNFTSATSANNSVNPAWNTSTTWGIIDNTSYPYLKTIFTSTPQIISGLVGVTGAGKNIQLALDGSLLTTTSTGANGFFYKALPANSVPVGGKLLTYISGDAVKANSVAFSSGSHLTGLTLLSGTLTTNNINEIVGVTFSGAKGSLSSSDILYSVSSTLDLGSNNLNIVSSGSVMQTIPIQAALLNTSSVGGTVLDLANTVSSFNATNTGNGDISLTNTGATLTITGISSPAGGNATIKNSGDIVLASASSIASSSGNPLNVTLNSDSDASGSGAILLNTGSSILSYGGNILLGGGTGQATGNAAGNTSGNIYGISINDATLNSGLGDITMRGKGGISSNGSAGIRIDATAGSTLISSAGGAISITGFGGITGTYTKDGMGAWIGSYAAGHTTDITNTGSGTITINGTGGNGTWVNNTGVWLRS